MIRQRSLFNKIKCRKWPWGNSVEVKEQRGQMRRAFRRFIDRTEKNGDKNAD